MLTIATDLADVLVVEDVCGEDDGEAEREEDDHEDLERGGLGGRLHLAGDCALNTVQSSPASSDTGTSVYTRHVTLNVFLINQ